MNARREVFKETTGDLAEVMRTATTADEEAREAGLSHVELFIRASNVGVAELLDFARTSGLGEIPKRGTLFSLTILARDGAATYWSDAERSK
jgi:hypothetical protein